MNVCLTVLCSGKANEQRNVIVSLFKLIVRIFYVSHNVRAQNISQQHFGGLGGVSVCVYVFMCLVWGASKLKMPQMRKIQVQIGTRAAH